MAHADRSFQKSPELPSAGGRGSEQQGLGPPHSRSIRATFHPVVSTVPNRIANGTPRISLRRISGWLSWKPGHTRIGPRGEVGKGRRQAREPRLVVVRNEQRGFNIKLLLQIVEEHLPKLKPISPPPTILSRKNTGATPRMP